MADEKKKEAAAQPKSNEKSAKPEKAKKDTAAKKDSSKDGKASRGARARKSIAKFFKDFRSECKKIVWPDRKTVLKSSLVSIVAVTILAVILWLVDTGLAEGVKALANLAKDVGGVETTTAAAGAMLTGLLGL